MANLDETLLETALRLLQNVEKLPIYRDDKKERIRQLIRDGAKKIKAQLYDEAINCFEEAILLNPRSLGTHLAMIKGFRAKGKDLEALSWGGFALALANTRDERKTIYLLLGSTALDTFKLSLALDHANQSLDFYQLALEEDPTELRAVWNSVETHIEIVCAKRLEETIRIKHKMYVEKKLLYLNDSLMRKMNVSLARKFIEEGEKIEKRLNQKSISVPEFSDGFGRLRMLMEDDEIYQDLTQEFVDSPESYDKGAARKILAYILATVISTSMLSLMSGDARGAEPFSQVETYETDDVRSQPMEEISRIERVFALGVNGELEVVTVDPDWDEVELLATVDPDWDEVEKFL